MEVRDLLLRGASDEFKACGYSGATTAAIARRAGVTEAQLFRHFGSKSELFREAVFLPLNAHFTDFHARQLADAGNSGDMRGKAHAYINELQEFIGEHAKMLMSLVVAQTYAPGSTQTVGEIDSLRAYFDRGAAMMTSRLGDTSKVDPQLMVRVSFAAVLANVMFKDWLFPEGLASERDIGTAIVDFVIDGINANSDPGLKAAE
jgi:AcrR family transcriptional regulator